MVKLPKNVRDEVRTQIYRRADAHNYMERTRSENSVFMDNLIADPLVGKRLEEFIEREKVRIYIKDGVLNQYAKEKQRSLFVADPTDIIKKMFSVETAIMKEDTGISLCVSSQHRQFVVCRGTTIKWETAVRKAIEFVIRHTTGRPEIVLYLVEPRANMTSSDYEHIKHCMNLIGINVSWN